ncbi:MAG: hypothetical protein ACXAB2_08760, partial [Candidatus Hodarchaeales archaeon]
TGGIDLDLTDNFPFSNFTTTHAFDVSCSTGSINIQSRLHLLIGLKITASVSTGTIDLLGGGSPYTSAIFDSSSVKYDFTLSSSTGDITYSTSG